MSKYLLQDKGEVEKYYEFSNRFKSSFSLSGNENFCLSVDEQWSELFMNYQDQGVASDPFSMVSSLLCYIYMFSEIEYSNGYNCNDLLQTLHNTTPYSKAVTKETEGYSQSLHEIFLHVL